MASQKALFADVPTYFRQKHWRPTQVAADIKHHLSLTQQAVDQKEQAGQAVLKDPRKEAKPLKKGTLLTIASSQFCMQQCFRKAAAWQTETFMKQQHSAPAILDKSWQCHDSTVISTASFSSGLPGAAARQTSETACWDFMNFLHSFALLNWCKTAHRWHISFGLRFYTACIELPVQHAKCTTP